MTRKDICNEIAAVLGSLDSVLEQASERGFEVDEIRELSAAVVEELAAEAGEPLTLAA